MNSANVHALRASIYQNLKCHIDWYKWVWPITYLLINQDACEQSWLNSTEISCTISWSHTEFQIWWEVALSANYRNAAGLVMIKTCACVWWSHSFFKHLSETWNSLLLVALILANWAAAHEHKIAYVYFVVIYPFTLLKWLLFNIDKSSCECVFLCFFHGDNPGPVGV